MELFERDLGSAIQNYKLIQIVFVAFRQANVFFFEDIMEADMSGLAVSRRVWLAG